MAEKYLENVQFLVVDDNMFIRTTVRRVLKTMGSRDVREASNGAEGLKLLENYRPDIIVADWEMDPINGIEFVERIRGNQESPLAFIPIIMLTGHSEAERVKAARDAGINEFIVKPFSAQGLFTRIHAVIERPRPFVRVEDYFGPDRRRKSLPIDGEDRRGGDSGEQEDAA